MYIYIIYIPAQGLSVSLLIFVDFQCKSDLKCWSLVILGWMFEVLTRVAMLMWFSLNLYPYITLWKYILMT